MKFDEDKNTFTLSTGRSFYAYGNQLNPDPYFDFDAGVPSSGLNYGHDGYVSVHRDERPGSFTPAERREIADEFIKRWEEWARFGHVVRL